MKIESIVGVAFGAGVFGYFFLTYILPAFNQINQALSVIAH